MVSEVRIGWVRRPRKPVQRHSRGFGLEQCGVVHAEVVTRGRGRPQCGVGSVLKRVKMATLLDVSFWELVHPWDPAYWCE